MKFNKSYETETVYDIAIQITNYLVELGYVKDCTDTDDTTEFSVQEAINEILEKKFIIENKEEIINLNTSRIN